METVGQDDAVGYDAGKKVKGRKLHGSSSIPRAQDRDGAGLVLDKIRRRFPWLELVWADSGVAKVPGLRIEIVRRSDDMKGFVVLPRRWVVHRIFSRFGRNRRLTKDYENLADTLAAIHLGIRRLARA